jgi:SAM-dependent methyltransferase
MITENIYGYKKRLEWLISHINKNELSVEFGCGTGYMISRPMTMIGYTMIGVDLDRASVEYGNQLFVREGLPGQILQTIDLADLDVSPDAVIASEVLEHIPDKDLPVVVETIHNKLKPEGKLLVTVPNGYGWFELESFLWFKLGMGKILEVLQIVRIVNKLKRIVFNATDYEYPSTIADSPHMQRFTYDSIQSLLRNHGFEVESITGSVLFAGPFSNLFFTGIRPVMYVNRILGARLPRIAAGFYVSCRKLESLSGIPE